MVVYLSYNTAGSNNLAGLKQLLVAHRPDYVFMQEVSATKEQMEAHLGRSYCCQVNVDPENPNQPGSAVAWRSSMEVMVTPVVPCRLQTVKSVHGSFINIYATLEQKVRLLEDFCLAGTWWA